MKQRLSTAWQQRFSSEEELWMKQDGTRGQVWGASSDKRREAVLRSEWERQATLTHAKSQPTGGGSQVSNQPSAPPPIQLSFV